MLWTPERLHTFLDEMRHRRGDTTSVEVKRASGGLPDVSTTVCAFANMPSGGTIVLGVNEGDADFDIVGVSDVARLDSGLVATARQSVSPSPHITTQALRVDGKDVLIAHVAPLRIADRPATVGQRAYLRQSDGDYLMQEHELRMTEVAKLHADEQISYDLQPARGRDRSDLVPELVASYVGRVRARDRRLSGRDDEEILRATNVLTAAGEPTLAGLYALADYPQGQYPALTVTAAVQLGGSEGHLRNRNLQDFTGPVPVLLQELMVWVEQNIDTVRRYRSDGHVEAVPELPLNAVRELLANALVHRDLGPNTVGVGKGIQVRLTRQSLFIQSPGGLRGVSLAQLESAEHAQAAVNQRLYQIANKLTIEDGASVIEGEGGGIREVFASALARGLPRPQLIDTGVQFKALLWRVDRDTPSRRRDKPGVPEVSPAVPRSSNPTRHEPAVLAALSSSHGLSIHAVAAAAQLKVAQVRYALARPLAEELVIMEGGQGQKTTTYRLAPPT